MNEKITAQPPKEERQEVLKEIRQLENRKKILENKQRNEERRVRTRRLIERGAILEGIFPLASSLSGAEVKAFLIALSYLPAAAATAERPSLRLMILTGIWQKSMGGTSFRRGYFRLRGAGQTQSGCLAAQSTQGVWGA